MGNRKLRCSIYSNYNSKKTFKTVDGVAHCGIITFVSDLYCGCKSEILYWIVDSSIIVQCWWHTNGPWQTRVLTFDRFSLLSPAAKCWIFLLFSTMGSSHKKSDHRNIASAWIYVELAVPNDYILHYIQAVLRQQAEVCACMSWKVCFHSLEELLV